MTTSNMSHFHRHTLIFVWPQHKNSFVSWAIPNMLSFHILLSHWFLKYLIKAKSSSIFWNCLSLLYTLSKSHLKFTTISLPKDSPPQILSRKIILTIFIQIRDWSQEEYTQTGGKWERWCRHWEKMKTNVLHSANIFEHRPHSKLCARSYLNALRLGWFQIWKTF